MGVIAKKGSSDFNPELYPNDFHICYNGKYNSYGSIIHGLSFFIIGENGKQTEIGKYDVCTKCREILNLKFNNVLNDTYKTNIHKLFKQSPKSTFFFKDEVISGKINENTIPRENENWKEYKRRYIAYLEESGYAYKEEK